MKRSVYILADSDALKPNIVLEKLINLRILDDYDIFFLTNNLSSGRNVEYCKLNGIPILDYNSTLKRGTKLLGDILVSVGWPRLIDLDTLTRFKFGGVNCHGSYLPDYRGSRAYMHYWANCSSFFGATIHYLDESFDSGNILTQDKTLMFSSDTPESIHYRTSELCAYLLLCSLPKVFSGDKGQPQSGPYRYFYPQTYEFFKDFHTNNLEKTFKDLTPHKTGEC